MPRDAHRDRWAIEVAAVGDGAVRSDGGRARGALTRLFGLLVLMGWVALAGCSGLPVALNVAAGVGFGAAGVVQRSWQTEEIRELREEIKRFRETMGKNGEGRGATHAAARSEEGWW